MTEPTSPDLVSASQLERIMRHPTLSQSTTQRLVMRYHGAINLTPCIATTSRQHRASPHSWRKSGTNPGAFATPAEIWGPTPPSAATKGVKTSATSIRVTENATWVAGSSRSPGGRITNVSAAIGVDFLGSPHLLETTLYAALSAGWYWDSHLNLNALADVGDFNRITRVINGGTNGLKDRIAMLETALQVIA